MLRVIGDIHGKFGEYNRIAGAAKYSVQVGDMGFDYTNLKTDPFRHRFIGGNHDNYDGYYDTYHALGDFGLARLNNVEFFFVRGAYSIDKQWRILQKHKCWWDNEELTYYELTQAIKLYDEYKPNIVITHTCPIKCNPIVSNDNVLRDWGFNPADFRPRTAIALEVMLETHQPALWLFGHFHRRREFKLDGFNTQFVALEECGYYDIL